MGSSENLLKATLNRLTVRIGKKIVNTASEIAVIAQDAPERIKEEWELLKDEIITEAKRLDLKNNEKDGDEDLWDGSKKADSDPSKIKIDEIRSKISAITREIEDKP